MSVHDNHTDHPGRPNAGRSDRALGASETTLQQIGDALHGLRYGSVLAIVQDGIVVQIERTEKTRLEKSDR